jgi:YidC/Oxa1 family membrane protein insertase
MLEKKTLLALLLTVVILFVFQFYFSPKEPEAPQKPAPAATQASKTEAETKAPAAKAGTATAQPDLKPTKRVIVETPKFTVTLSDLGGAITSVVLKDYKQKVDGTHGKELFEDMSPYKYMPALSDASGAQAATDATIFVPDRNAVTVKSAPEKLVFSGTMTNGRKVKKIYTFNPDGYTIGIEIQLDSGKGKVTADFAMISLKEKPSYTFKGPLVYNGKSLKQVDDLKKDVEVKQAYTYAGLDEGYFSFLWIPGAEAKPELTVLDTKTNVPLIRLTSDQSMSGSLYFGPNRIEVLKELNVNAQKIVDFGWFDIVAKPMLWGMNFSNRLTRNYGIDIILLTILIKIIFYPLSLKSYKSMKEMQKLQPVIAKLKEKFKDDKEKLNREMMDIYKRKGVNPLGGCLPMVIQIPVFFALYKVLMAAIEFRHAPFFLWINDLAAPEDLWSFAVAGYTIPIRILPLIMGITQVIQQKMTPTTADPIQEKMMLFMPIFFTFLFWGFPAGLVLYWLVNNVLSIAQQYYTNTKTT